MLSSGGKRILGTTALKFDIGTESFTVPAIEYDGSIKKRLNLYFLFDFRSEKANITYRALWLAFGGIATALLDHLQPPRHQVPEVLSLEGRARVL